MAETLGRRPYQPGQTVSRSSRVNRPKATGRRTASARSTGRRGTKCTRDVAPKVNRNI